MEKMIVAARVLLMILEGISGKRSAENLSEERGVSASKLWDEVAKKSK